MQLNSLKIKGIGPYKSEVNIDIDALNGVLTAVTGENGAGKTVILECWAGAMYRDTPTYGSLKGLAVDRNAFVEAVITNGRQYTVRQLIDSVSGKGEALVTHNGQPLNTSGKLPEFDEWAATHFLSPDVFYSSVFTPQAYAGFLGLKRSERKAVILRVLGIERYEALAAQAREYAGIIKSGEYLGKRLKMPDPILVRLGIERGLVQIEADIAALGEVVKVADAEAALRDERMQAEVVEDDLKASRAALTAVEEAGRLAMEQSRIRGEKIRQRDDLVVRRQKAMQTVTITGSRITDYSEIMADAEKIRAAVADIQRLDTDIQEKNAEVSRLVSEINAVDTSEKHYLQQAAQADRALIVAQRRVQAIEDRCKRRTAIDTAKPLADNLRGAVEVARTELARARAETERLNGLALSSAEERATSLLTGHKEILALDNTLAVIGYQARDISQECVRGNDAALKLAQELPGLKKAAARALQEADLKVADAESNLRHVELLISAEADVIAAEGELKEAQQDHIILAQQVETLAQSIQRLTDSKDPLTIELQQIRNDLQNLNANRRILADDANRANALTQAETVLVELRSSEQAAATEVQELDAALLEIVIGEPVGIPTTATERQAVEQAERNARSADAVVVLAERALATAQATAERFDLLQQELAVSNRELADWTRLAEDFGRDGLQALEIDAAGPELSETINDLLRSCIGPRWTVSVETTRMSSDKKKQIEGCDIIVVDNETGRAASGEAFSGGQKVIIGEAISLALTKLACQRAGIVGPTLVRDESGAALSAKYAPLHMKMLRRAVEIIGAARLLYVSHNPEVQALADSSIHVNSDGTVTIQ